MTRSALSPTSLVNACLDGCKHRHGTCHAGQCFGSRGNRGAADESKRRAHPGPRRRSVLPFFALGFASCAAFAIAEAWRPHGHAQLSGQPQTLSSRQKADTWSCKCSTATGLVGEQPEVGVLSLRRECACLVAKICATAKRHDGFLMCCQDDTVEPGEVKWWLPLPSFLGVGAASPRSVGAAFASPAAPSSPPSFGWCCLASSFFWAGAAFSVSLGGWCCFLVLLLLCGAASLCLLGVVLPLSFKI